MAKLAPTRMNLLARQAHVRLARRGVDLLDRKREALLREFTAGIRPLAAARESLRARLGGAFLDLTITRGLDGRERLLSACLALERETTIEARERNIWGVKIAEIRSVAPARLPSCPISIGLRVDDTARSFREALELIVSVAPLESKIRILGGEIRRTTRKINALKEILLPGWRAEIQAIRATLEEREREDLYRLKHLKRKKRKRRSAGEACG